MLTVDLKELTRGSVPRGNPQLPQWMKGLSLTLQLTCLRAVKLLERAMALIIMTGETSFTSASPPVSPYAPTFYEELCDLAVFSSANHFSSFLSLFQRTVPRA